MILVSPEIKAALEASPVIRTEAIDLRTYPDMIAGESVIDLKGERYGVVRYEPQRVFRKGVVGTTKAEGD